MYYFTLLSDHSAISRFQFADICIGFSVKDSEDLCLLIGKRYHKGKIMYRLLNPKSRRRSVDYMLFIIIGDHSVRSVCVAPFLWCLWILQDNEAICNHFLDENYLIFSDFSNYSF